MDIIIFSFLTNFIYYCTGSIFLSNKKNDNNKIFYLYFFGIIFVSFISLFLNFFIPLSPKINLIVYILIILIYLAKNKFHIKFYHFKFLILSTLITFFLLAYSDLNRPDAGLYHLPYISVLNENKIILGLSNLHFRFGHVSILQYIAAINYNSLFTINSINIPLASIVSFFFLYFFLDIWSTKKNNNLIDLSKIFSLFVFIYFIFKISRYSSFGNDAVGHLSFFYLISYVLKNKIHKLNLNKILLISVFTFLNKSTLGLVFFFPLTVYIFQNNFKFRHALINFFSLPIFFLVLWLIKNILVSGCLIYPIKSMCLESLSWTDIKKIEQVNLESEAWSKAWPDREKKNLSMIEFNKDFNWYNAWSKKHFKYILKILIPYIIILILVTFYLLTQKKYENLNRDKDLNIRLSICYIICLLGTLTFFLIFPLFRYGYSYLISSIIITFMLILKINKVVYTKFNIFKFIMITCLIIFFGKNSMKIFVNTNKNIWPNIYSFDENNLIYKKTKLKIEDEFYYYIADKGDKLCMYSNSPCSSYLVNQNITHINFKNYSILKVK